jgi:hypothetical protein
MLNAEGSALLRVLIFKMWSLNEARENGDCAAMAATINTWMPPGLKVSAADVQAALGRSPSAAITVNLVLLRTKIDKTPSLFSARLSGDYQAILNEVIADPELRHATLADVVEAMALRPVSRPTLTVAGSAKLIGKAALG